MFLKNSLLVRSKINIREQIDTGNAIVDPARATFVCKSQGNLQSIKPQKQEICVYVVRAESRASDKTKAYWIRELDTKTKSKPFPVKVIS